MFLGTRENDNDPQKQLFLTLNAPNNVKWIKNPKSFSEILFSKTPTSHKSFLGKRRVPEVRDICLIRSWKSWIWDECLAKKHAMESVQFSIQLKKIPPLAHLPFAMCNQHSPFATGCIFFRRRHIPQTCKNSVCFKADLRRFVRCCP